MAMLGYALVVLVVLVLTFMGGMHYSDRSSFSCQYVGGVTDSTLFEDKTNSTHKVLVLSLIHI